MLKYLAQIYSSKRHRIFNRQMQNCNNQQIKKKVVERIL